MPKAPDHPCVDLNVPFPIGGSVETGKLVTCGVRETAVALADRLDAFIASATPTPAVAVVPLRPI